ncbi:MAG: signal peptide peptidase SppA [Bacteroidales bacterium]|nr:signal peptide peptidase SppA [Bacteroidales bacterium]MDY4933628.1 signal peptide peptidase SppA [Candidatus Onthomorpha sp.]MCI6900736.1 signal peptide peptidase SppA [Bacteroidales bacterium]MCI7562116.1 signal peptide peptidase SppA [Bacteroidales bacterium]MCI7572278.1 signal peptide peptidase SppA [Bacteroidales bacterium]
MKQFFKFTLASFLGVLFCTIFVFLVLSGILGSMMTTKESVPEIKDNSVLLIRLDKPIYDREVSDISSLAGAIGGESVGNIGLTEFIYVIQRAKTDSKIKAIMLDLAVLQTGGWATVEEMRQCLADFKTSGKKIYAYGDMMTQSSYYLASVADQIVLNPAGMITLTGLGAEVMYYKDLLDKFDVDVELIRPKNNSYKSAGEKYITNSMSQENREQIKTYMSAIWEGVSANIVKDRKLTKEEFERQVSDLQGCLPQDALKNKLVDKLSFKTNLMDDISKEIVAQNKLKEGTKANFVKYSKYRKSVTDIFNHKKDNIAIVYAYGDVNQGKGSELSIGSETIVKALQQAAKNKSVKAVVLRVNSPGGDAIASELITNEVIKTKKIKPVIVSMGDVAASAGYEMSSNATKIVALPLTITGSIGVFGVMPNFARSLKNNLGITFDTVKTHSNSVAMSVTTKPSPEFKMMMQRNVENFYDNFITRVSEGRNKDKAYIDSIARGRVWAGSQAKALGLVDEHGGLKQAIETAARQAGISDYGLIAYPKTKDIATQLLETLSGENEMKTFAKELGKPYSFFLELKSICQMQGVQARMPYLINF